MGGVVGWTSTAFVGKPRCKNTYNRPNGLADVFGSLPFVVAVLLWCVLLLLVLLLLQI